MSSLVLTAMLALAVAVGEPQTRSGDASPALERARDLLRQAETETGPDAEAHRAAARQLVRQAQLPPVARVALSTLVYDAGGNVPSTTTSTLTGAFTTYVYARRSVCELAGTASEVPKDAGFGWRVTGRPIGVRTSEPSDDPAKVTLELRVIAVEVQVDWQRMWEGGKPVSGPSGSTRLTLRSGDRVPLDNITATPVEGGCSGTSMTLYVSPGGEGVRTSGAGRVASVGARSGGGGGVGTVSGRAASPVRGTASGGGRAGGGVSPGPGGAAFGGTGGGARSGGVAGAGGGRQGVSQCDPNVPLAGNGLRVVEPGGACVIVVSPLDPATLQTVNTDVWLVHTLPSGTEEVQFQKVATVPYGGRFTFPLVLTEAALRNTFVGVTGFLQAQRLSTGGENLEVKIITTLRDVSTMLAISVGASGKTIPLPGSDEVVSFEVPLDGLGADPGGHKFALRVRASR